MPWMLLTPREVDTIARARCPADGLNAGILAVLQGPALNRLTGDLDLTDAQLAEARAALRRWQHGAELAFDAVIRAAGRHGA